MSKVKVIVRPNGPFRVEDPDSQVELVDAEGNAFDLTGKQVFALCRCSLSANKPFCDGSHKNCAPAAAPAELK
jgi:CDGSH-type Zn-finger protein